MLDSDPGHRTFGVMKFLCFAYEAEEDLNQLSQSEWQDLRKETLDYVQALRDRGILVDTHPLQSARLSASVSVRDGKAMITDGPLMETKEQIGGYFLIEAVDRETALEIAAGWPSARIGRIEVRPVDDGLAMDRRYH